MNRKSKKAAEPEVKRNEIIEALEALEQEKGISKDYMLERIGQALAAAYKALYKKNEAATAENNVFVEIDQETGAISIQVVKTVVEFVENPVAEMDLEEAAQYAAAPQLGDQIRLDVDMKTFGRIATQTAKQVIIQGIREAEHSKLVEAYSSRTNQIITGVITRVDQRFGSVYVDLGPQKEGSRERSEGQLSKQEQVPGETYVEGQRIRVYVVEVRAGNRGPQIVLSRTHPGLVKQLFQLEVPEISDGTVTIANVAREAGSRTKLAVTSEDENVDPIGACVGPRGARVAAVVEELHGEKIDIIKYSEDPVQFVAEALSPADVVSVQMGADGKSCTVVVPNDQLSLAIGKEGQNARLAAKLTGFKIDIKPQL